MSALYRNTLLKLLADQARAERVAAQVYSRWIRRAPGPNERMYLGQLAKEETEHWCTAIRLLEQLGVRGADVPRYQTRNWFYLLSRLSVGRMRWIDVLMMSFLIDHGAYFLVEDFSQSSYAPWAEAAREMLEQEVTHPQMGVNCLRLLIRQQGRQRVQRALHKWWRIALNMFGPPITKNTELYIRLGLKFRSNEQRRQAYRQSCEPKIQELGLEIPKLRHPSYPFF